MIENLLYVKIKGLYIIIKIILNGGNNCMSKFIQASYKRSIKSFKKSPSCHKIYSKYLQPHKSEFYIIFNLYLNWNQNN